MTDDESDDDTENETEKETTPELDTEITKQHLLVREAIKQTTKLVQSETPECSELRKLFGDALVKKESLLGLL